MKRHFKSVILLVATSAVIGISGCSDQKEPNKINTGMPDTQEIDQKDIVFYDLGKSSKSIEAELEAQQKAEPKSPYKECDSDSDCLIKNKHVFNPFDPKNTGLSEDEKIPLETKPKPKQLDDELFNLIDELGAVQQDLTTHRTKTTVSSSTIEKETLAIEERKIDDAIEVEMKTIEARRIMSHN